MAHGLVSSPLEPTSPPPRKSSLASFQKRHDTWLTGSGTALRWIIRKGGDQNMRVRAVNSLYAYDHICHKSRPADRRYHRAGTYMYNTGTRARAGRARARSRAGTSATCMRCWRRTRTSSVRLPLHSARGHGAGAGIGLITPPERRRRRGRCVVVAPLVAFLAHASCVDCSAWGAVCGRLAAGGVDVAGRFSD